MADYRMSFVGGSLKAFEECLSLVPYRTGKLKNKGIKYKATVKGSTIYIDLSVCPYGAYIDEPGHKTAGWWNRFCEAYRQKLIQLKRR